MNNSIIYLKKFVSKGIICLFFFLISCSNKSINTENHTDIVSDSIVPIDNVDVTATISETQNYEDTICQYINSQLSALKKEYAYYTKMRMTNFPLELNTIDRLAELAKNKDTLTLNDFINITAYFTYCRDEGYTEGAVIYIGRYLLENKKMQNDVIQWSKCLPLKVQHRLYTNIASGLFDVASIHFEEQQISPIPTRLMLDYIRKDLSRDFLNYMDSIGANFYEYFYYRQSLEEGYLISAPECIYCEVDATKYTNE